MNYPAILKYTITLSLVILFTFGASTPAHAAGFVLQTSGTAVNLNGVSFSDALSGLAAGDGGVIRKTINGGASWSTSVSGTSAILNDVFLVPSTSVAYVVGNSGTIRKSINLGTSWAGQSSGTLAHLRAVHFSSTDQNGLAAGDSGIIRKTTNGGASWMTSTSGTIAPLNDVFIVPSASIAYVVGNDGVIRKSINLGTSWSPQSSGTAAHLQGVYFIDALNGWVVGNSGTIRRTTDGGANWNGQSSGTAAHLLAVQFIDSQNGWASGDDGVILQTTDGGSTWASITSNTLAPLFGLNFTSASNGWAVGGGGAILHYDDSPPPNPDTTTPNTTITSSPASTTTATSAAFEFTATEAAAFECRLDGGTFTACASPRSYLGLTSGGHTFEVRAIDTAGNIDPTPALYSWTITSSNTAPNTPTSLSQHDQPGDPAAGVGFTDYTNDTQLTFQGVVNDLDAGQLTRLEIEFQFIGMAFTNTVTASSPLVSSGAIAMVTYGGISNGSYHWQARTADAAGATSPWISFGGNSESSVDFAISASAGVDASAPTGTVLINGGATATNSTAVTLTLSCSDNLGCTQMQVATDGAASTEAFETFLASKTVTLPSGSGTKTVAVKFRDAAGNVSLQVTDTIVLDTVSPTMGGILPTTVTAGVTQAFTVSYFDSQGLITCDLYVDSVNQGAMMLSGGTSGTASRFATFTSPGGHVFQARCADAAGNVGLGPLTTVTVVGAVVGLPTPLPLPPPLPLPSSPAPPPSFPLERLFSDATVVVTGDRNFLLAYASITVCQADDATAAVKIGSVLGTISNSTVRTAIINFTACGTPTALHLGLGERLGAVNSYRAAFGRLPSTAAHWDDVLKLANGRFPGETSALAEAAAKTRFRAIYLREPNLSQQHDKAAVTIMAYGLRPLPRNMNSERVAITNFRGIFRYSPVSATDWDAVRAIAYSGARR